MQTKSKANTLWPAPFFPACSSIPPNAASANGWTWHESIHASKPTEKKNKKRYVLRWIGRGVSPLWTPLMPLLGALYYAIYEAFKKNVSILSYLSQFMRCPRPERAEASRKCGITRLTKNQHPAKQNSKLSKLSARRPAARESPLTLQSPKTAITWWLSLRSRQMEGVWICNQKLS